MSGVSIVPGMTKKNKEHQGRLKFPTYVHQRATSNQSALQFTKGPCRITKAPFKLQKSPTVTKVCLASYKKAFELQKGPTSYN